MINYPGTVKLTYRHSTSKQLILNKRKNRREWATRGVMSALLFCVLFLSSFPKTQAQISTDSMKLAAEIHVHFQYNKYDLPEDEVSIITAMLDTLAANPVFDFELSGHTDSKGTVSYNMHLSQKRVKTVAALMIRHGITANRLISAWYGESHPIATNQTEAGRAKNRRTTIKVYHPNKPLKLPESYIFGKVTDAETSKPLIGQLEFQPMVEDSVPAQLQSNKSGGYQYKPDKWQDFFVTCFVPGYVYQTHLLVLPIGENQAIELNFALKPVRKDSAFVAENIYFFPDLPKVLPSSMPALDRLNRFMHQNEGVHIEIRGHVNWPSTYFMDIPANVALLSELRAKTVFNYLSGHGVEKERLEYKGMSNKEMVYPDAETSEEYRKNMRVEIVITKE